MNNEKRGRRMKEGWKYEPIGKLFRTYAGGTPLKQNKEYYEGGNIPWLRSGEVCQKYITHTELFITEEGLKNSSAKFFPIDTVVIAMYGATAAQVGIIKAEMTSNQAVCGICPKESFLPEFIYYFFVSNQKILAAQAQGGAQPNISQDKIKKVLIPVPPLSEQQSIVAHLDASFAEIDALKAKAAEEVANAKAMFDAALREEMTPKEGWEEKKLNEIGDSKVGPFGSLLHKSDYIVGGIPLINPMHIVNGCIKADSNFSINKEKYSELQAFVMKEGDIVIARRGEMGRCAVVNSNQSGYLCGTGSIFYRPNKSLVNSVFLQLLISSENIKKEIVKIAGGATMLNLSSKGLNSLTISIPQIEAQQLIVTKLDTLRSHLTELEQKYNLIAANCDALKQAILRETFE